ncbi:MAG: BolA/IbaG family iron-sulfur metabolism protein [Alphaproteobacteria bacterium]|nr:BolA/IbaG family iron-sulfur metabolism protein [Alphaproteobacteria bacterium]
MSGHHPTDFQGDILQAIEAAIREAIPGCQVQASGGGGHFEIDVVAAQFAGKRTLAKHRMVLGAIKHLMDGDAAPVHAVDRIGANTP